MTESDLKQRTIRFTDDEWNSLFEAAKNGNLSMFLTMQLF